jgi:hypothetical protein
MPRIELTFSDGVVEDARKHFMFLLNMLRYAVYTEVYANRVLSYIMFDKNWESTQEDDKVAVVDSRYFLYYARGFCFDRMGALSVGVGGRHWSAAVSNGSGFIPSPPIGINPTNEELEEWYAKLTTASRINMSSGTVSNATIELSDVSRSSFRSKFTMLAHEMTHLVGSSHGPTYVKPVALSARVNKEEFFQYLGYQGDNRTFNDIGMEVNFTTNAIQFVSGAWFSNFQKTIIPAQFSSEEVSVDDIYARCPELEYYK